MTGAVTRQHSSVKRYRALARTPGGNGLDRELLLDGVHLLAEAHASGLTIDTAAFEHALLDQPEVRALAERLTAAGTEVLIVSRNVLEAMSPVKTPSGAVGIARHSLVSLRDALGRSPALVVLAHDVQDPGNVGALLRTAEAAGATAFVACGGTADPARVEGAAGIDGQRAAGPHRARGHPGRRCAVPRTPAFRWRRWCRATAIRSSPRICGADGAAAGKRRRAASRRRSPRKPTGASPFPCSGPIESLNVAVAAALVLYEAFRQRFMNLT